MDDGSEAEARFTRVVAVIVALEHYRKPAQGDPFPSIDYAHADADAFEAAIKDLAPDTVVIEAMKDGNASLTALQDHLGTTIKNLGAGDLFLFYYVGHGFHGDGGNRLSTYDTSRGNLEGTSLSLRDEILEPLAGSACRQALLFLDACAEELRGVVPTRDDLANLDPQEVKAFIGRDQTCSVFLSCSPGEKSYSASSLGHGVWAHFLMEALSGRAERALTPDRWLTDVGLGDYLGGEVARFITRETSARGSQTPVIIRAGSNGFAIRPIPQPSALQAEAALAGIMLRNNSEFLEGTETGAIRRLEGFQRGRHTVPTELNDRAESWCHRLLTDRIAEELQDLYERTRKALRTRRNHLRKEQENGGADLDTPAFRYSIETGQNPEDPAEYIIRRRLELRQGWPAHRSAIDDLFGNAFDRLVVEFESLDETFDGLVEKLEDIRDRQGGDVGDDDRTKRATYARDGVTFTFDLKKRRLEISFGRSGTLDLVDAAQRFQFGIDRPSPMLSVLPPAKKPRPSAKKPQRS